MAPLLHRAAIIRKHNAPFQVNASNACNNLNIFTYFCCYSVKITEVFLSHDCMRKLLKSLWYKSERPTTKQSLDHRTQPLQQHFQPTVNFWLPVEFPIYICFSDTGGHLKSQCSTFNNFTYSCRQKGTFFLNFDLRTSPTSLR